MTMELYINTTEGNNIEVAIKEGDNIVASEKFEAPHEQAEKLLPAILNLKTGNKNFNIRKDIKKIIVANRGGSFTALRIGVVTANALGFAWDVPVEALGGSLRSEDVEDRFARRTRRIASLGGRGGSLRSKETEDRFARRIASLGGSLRSKKSLQEKGFDKPVLPVYDREPNITKKKD